MELLKKITPEEISPTLHIGREDSPELGTEGMQQLFDAHPNINSANTNYNVEIQNRNNTAVQAHMDNTKNPHSVTKAQVGLGNVDNTTDLNKPVSTAQQNALDLKADKANTYTQAEVDAGLATKANTIDVNTKLATKADISYADQKDADTLVSAKTYADQKVVDIGTGDMAMAVYDPWGRKSNVFEHIEDMSIHTPALTANKQIFVANDGSNETGNGTIEKPYKDIMYAYKTVLHNHAGYDAYIKCKNGAYDEDINVIGHYNGLISISGYEENTDVTVNSILIERNTNVEIFAIKVKGFVSSGLAQVYIDNCNKVKINGLKAEAIDKTKTGIWSNSTPNLTIQNSTISNKQMAIRCGAGTSYLANIKGSNNTIGYVAFEQNGLGGTIHLGYECTLTANTLIQELHGGRVFSSQNANESGTWTPRLFSTQDTITTKYTITNATYSKVGKDVTLWWQIYITEVGTAVGGADIIGIVDLPYVISNQYPIGSYVNSSSQYFGMYGQRLNAICYPLVTNRVLKFGDLAVGTYNFELKYQTN